MKTVPILYAGMADEHLDDGPYDFMDDDDLEDDFEIWLDDDLGVYLNSHGAIVHYFLH